MAFRRTRLEPRHLMATEVWPIDLPADPISHLVLTLIGLNTTDEATLAELLSFLNTITVSRKGITYMELESEDLYGVHAYLLRRLPEITGRLATDNYNRTLTMIIPFGRQPYDPSECLPAAPEGERKLYLDCTVPATSWDGAYLSVDCIELPGASPQRYLKSYRKAVAAPGATGEHDVVLNCGNRLLAHQLRMVTIPGAASVTWGIEDVTLKRGNTEHVICSADVACLCGERGLRLGAPDLTIAAQGLGPLNLFAWIDYDPLTAEDGGIDLSSEVNAKLVCHYGVNEALVLTSLELAPTGG